MTILFTAPLTFYYTKSTSITQAKNGTTTTELTISFVRPVQPKDGDKEWFQGLFTSTLHNKQRCLLETNKDIWVCHQSDVAMPILWGSMINKAKDTWLENNILTNLSMPHKIPWQNAWWSFKNQVLKLQSESMKYAHSFLVTINQGSRPLTTMVAWYWFQSSSVKIQSQASYSC
jgi:hypothetical protein